VTAAAILGTNLHTPQPVGNPCREDENKLLRLVHRHIFQGDEHLLRRRFHRGERYAHGSVRTCQLDVATDQTDILSCLRRTGGNRSVGGTGLRHGTVQQRPYHSRLGEEFHTAAFHLRAEQRPHAERGIHFYLLAVDGLRKVVFQYRATGAGAH